MKVPQSPFSAIVFLCVATILCAGAAFAGEEDPPAVELQGNPYLAPADSTPAELSKYLLRMQRKPKSIRRREGFAAAMLEAADRILAASKDETFIAGAVLAKFDILHEQGIDGDGKADEALVKLAAEYAENAEKKLARRAQFHLLERKALDAGELPAESLAPLLEELKKFLADETLTERHLRLASATVAVINRLPSDEDAANAYAHFGGLFAKSSNKRLREYGEKIAKGPKDDGGDARSRKQKSKPLKKK